MSSDSRRWTGVSLAVLCGGEAPFPPVPAPAWLCELFEDVMWVGPIPEPQLPGRCVPDPPGPACSLRGLLGGLDAAREERILVLGGRRRSLSPDLVLALLAAPDADAVVPRSAAGAEPLCALYRREPVRTLARTRLREGPFAMSDFLAELDVWHLEGAALTALRSAGQEPSHRGDA